MGTWPALSEIRDRVRTRVNEAAEGVWSDDALNRNINDNERMIAAIACCIQERQTLTTADYATQYRKVLFQGHTVIHVEYVPGSGTPRGLRKTTPKTLGRLDPLTGEPQRWFQWGQHIIIDPLPLQSYNLYAYVATYPTCEMYDDTDTPQVPAEFYEDIVVGATSTTLWKARKWGQSGVMYNQFVASLMHKRMAYMVPRIDTRNDVVIPDVVEYVAPGQRG